MQALIQPEQLVTTNNPQLVLRHGQQWLEPATASLWLEQLQQEVPWKQESIQLYGKRHLLPRLTCWMADPGCGYRYSGLDNVVEPWSPVAETLRHQLSEVCGWRFNSLLLNLYRSGRDAMGFHADDEPELNPDAPIASLSLGASRTFRFKPKKGHQGDDLDLELGHGDLLLMEPPTQQHWLHGLPKRLRVDQSRLNLTFRVVQQA